MSHSLSNEDVERVQAAIFAGQKIQAIKIYREGTGTGLKEAKDFVEALTVELRSTSPEKFTTPTGSGCAGAVLAVMLLASGAAWMLS